MRNTLGDLHNNMMAQIERLSDEDLTPEELETEITRAKAMTGVASQIISNGHLIIKAKEVYEDNVNADVKKPKLLEG